MFNKAKVSIFLAMTLVAVCMYACVSSSSSAVSIKDNSLINIGIDAELINDAGSDVFDSHVAQQSAANSLSSKCPKGMVEIEGEYCPEVEEVCLKWLDKDQSPSANSGIGPMRCAEFKSPTKCLSKKREHIHFCMSIFEYPGTEGSYPLVGMTYYQAKDIAKQDGNRLCTIEEFNFACEGEEMHPYGYGDGYHRDETACNIDKPWVDYKKFPESSWNDRDAGLYQAIKSDKNSLCKSWSNVFNINGNVDEILDSEKYENAVLSGGYWSTVRNRCRPKTTVHSKSHLFYQLGFRECSNINDKMQNSKNY